MKVAMQLEDKKAIVAEVNASAATALSAVVVDYRGMTVSQMTQLRTKARSSGVYLRVVRNTLAKRAVEGTEFECLRPALEGPTLLALSTEDPGSAARLFRDFKESDKFSVRALAIGGRLLAADQLDAVAKLPTRDEAISLLMSVMQAPVAKLARTLNEIPGKLVRTIAAIREQKEAASA